MSSVYYSFVCAESLLLMDVKCERSAVKSSFLRWIPTGAAAAHIKHWTNKSTDPHRPASCGVYSPVAHTAANDGRPATAVHCGLLFGDIVSFLGCCCIFFFFKRGFVVDSWVVVFLVVWFYLGVVLVDFEGRDSVTEQLMSSKRAEAVKEMGILDWKLGIRRAACVSRERYRLCFLYITVRVWHSHLTTRQMGSIQLETLAGLTYTITIFKCHMNKKDYTMQYCNSNEVCLHCLVHLRPKSVCKILFWVRQKKNVIKNFRKVKVHWNLMNSCFWKLVSVRRKH